MTAAPRSLDLQRLAMPLLASLTLGLAPFVPEPHLLGKLRWVAGGAKGMGLMDWGDLLMHGAPWVWLLVTAGLVLRDATSGRTPAGSQQGGS